MYMICIHCKKLKQGPIIKSRKVDPMAKNYFHSSAETLKLTRNDTICPFKVTWGSLLLDCLLNEVAPVTGQMEIMCIGVRSTKIALPFFQYDIFYSGRVFLVDLPIFVWDN